MRNLSRVLCTSISLLVLLCLTPGCSKSAKSARHLQRAEKYFTAGEYPKAEVEYLNVLQLDPRNSGAIGHLGTMYYEQGRFGRAYAFLSKASEMAPGDLDLRMKLATIYLSASKTKEAREQVNLVLDKTPTNSDAPVLLAETVATKADLEEIRKRLESFSKLVDTAPFQLAFGTLHFRERDMKGAEAAFKRARELDPKSSAAHYALGTLYWGRNDLTNAALELKAAAELSPARSVRRVRFADFKIKTGELEEGKRLLAEITRQAPDYIPAWIQQAEIALAEKKYDDCASLLNQALSRDPANYDALLLRGRLLLAKGDPAKAIAELERTGTLYERSPQVHYFLALAHLLDNDTPKALKSVNRALTLNPNFDEATLLLAQLDISRGDTASAISALNELLKRQPKLPQAYLLMGAARRAQGNLNEALSAYRRLAEIYPKSAEAALLTGQIYAQQNKKAEAREAFMKTLELAPNYLPALEYLVDLDLSDKQFAPALARVQPELDKNPKAPELQLLLAKVYAAQTNIDMAEKALLKAIDLNPNLQQPYLLLARLYVVNGKNQKALEKLNDALVKDPKDTKALMLMASIYEQMKDFSAARPAYEKLLAVNSKFYPALNNLAYLYSEKFDELDKAYDMARKARDLLTYKPQSGEETAEAGRRNFTEFIRAFSSDTLGWVVFKRGEYPYALSLIQESADKLPREPEVQFHLGMACYMLGQEERAQTALKLAVSAEKDFPGKEEAARRLAMLAIDAKTADATVLAGLEKQLRIQPGDPVVLTRLAAIYERDGSPDKSLKAYEAALKNNPKNVPVLVNLARMYSGSLHNPQRALELAKEAYKLAPEDSAIAAILGRLVFDSGDHAWALSLLEQVRDIHQPEILYDLAMAYYSVGRVTDAEATMRASLHASGPFARLNEAKSFLDLAPLSLNPAKALQAEFQARELLKSRPDDPPALMVAGLCSEHRGETQQARQDYERILNQFPEFLPARKHLAILLADLGDDKAYEMATKAREGLPEDTEVARAMGIAFFLRKDYPNAARLLEESVRKGVGDGKTMYYLGMAHYKLSKQAKDQPKEQNESKAALQRALALNVQSDFANDARRVLAELQ